MHHLSKSERKTSAFLLLGGIALPLVWVNWFAEVKIILFIEESHGLESISISDNYSEEANPFFERSSKASSLTIHGYFERKGQRRDPLEQTPRHRAALTDS